MSSVPTPTLPISSTARTILESHRHLPFPFADEDCAALIPATPMPVTHSAPPAGTASSSARSSSANGLLVGLARLFANFRAWNVLDEDEKLEILSMMPPMYHPDTSVTPIPPLEDEFLLYSTDWSGGVRQFEEDPSKKKRTNKWNVMKLGSLVSGGCFVVGDVFTLEHEGVTQEVVVSSVAGGKIEFTGERGSVTGVFREAAVQGPTNLAKAVWDSLFGVEIGGANEWDTTIVTRGTTTATLNQVRADFYALCTL